MNINSTRKRRDRNGDLLLALHSCTTTLGVAILDSQAPQESLSSKTFPIGRSLSNNILHCVETILPASSWHHITRISVAIGPGGFTGTRLSVAMARTLAQQLDCDLDGISSFEIMAPRLSKTLKSQHRHDPFWITQEIPRRGIVAGKYQIKNNLEIRSLEVAHELERPHLLNTQFKVEPFIKASNNVSIDIIQLLNLSLWKKNLKRKNHWQEVVPIYPTSPIKQSKI